jgi:hypothetical protein
MDQMMSLRKSAQIAQQQHRDVGFPEENKEDSLVFAFEASEELKEETKYDRVAFDPACRMRHTIHLDDYTDEEYFACWYTPEELKEMKGDLLDTLHRLERKEQVDEVNDTFRGLESHTKSGRRNKGQSRSTAIETVVGMMVSYKQSKDGKKISDECVAGAYKKCNKPSELVAYLSALGDQDTVRDLDMSVHTEAVRQKRGRRRCGFAMVSQ